MSPWILLLPLHQYLNPDINNLPPIPAFHHLVLHEHLDHHTYSYFATFTLFSLFLLIFPDSVTRFYNVFLLYVQTVGDSPSMTFCSRCHTPYLSCVPWPPSPLTSLSYPNLHCEIFIPTAYSHSCLTFLAKAFHCSRPAHLINLPHHIPLEFICFLK